MNQYGVTLIKRIRFIFCLGLLLWSIQGFSQGAEDNKNNQESDLRVIVVGNSFSRNATEFLPKLAQEGGHNLHLEKAEISGGSIKEHWEAVQIFKADPESAKGKPYRGKSLRDILQKGNWDMISFQQASTISADIATYLPYLDSLVQYTKQYTPDIEVVIHQTWSYRVDAPYWSRYQDEKRANSSKEMWEKSRSVYHAIAERYDVRIIPTGDAFWEIDSDSKWGYKKDTTFDFEKPKYPELPNQQHSLHVGYTWNSKKKFKFDSHHANNAGRYLGALVWYSFLFEESPKSLRFRPEHVSQSFGRKLRKVAWQVVRESNGW